MKGRRMETAEPVVLRRTIVRLGGNKAITSDD